MPAPQKALHLLPLPQLRSLLSQLYSLRRYSPRQWRSCRLCRRRQKLKQQLLQLRSSPWRLLRPLLQPRHQPSQLL